MRIFRAVLIFALALSLLFLISAAAKPIKLRVMHWGGPQEIEAVSKIIKELEKEKGFTAVQERAPSGNPYMEKALTQIAGGTPPDVIFVEVNNFKEFAMKGVLEDLAPYLENDKDINIKEYYPEIIDRFTVDGKLYVIPRDIAPICVIYYNKKLFDEAGLKYPEDGWNRDDFLKTAQKLTKYDASGKAVQFGFLDEWPIWEAWALSNGGKFVDNVKNPTKCTFDSKTAEGAQFRADLIHKYKVMPLPSQITYSGNFDASGMFMSGKVAMFYSGIWKTPFFREIKGFDWDVVTFPKGPGGLRAFPTGGSGYAIVKQSKKKAAAWELVKRLSGKEGQKDLAAIGLLQPAIMKLAASPVFLDGKAPKHKDIVLKAVKDVVFAPYFARWEEVNLSYLAPGLDKVWNGTETAEKVFDDITPKINKEFFNK